MKRSRNIRTLPSPVAATMKYQYPPLEVILDETRFFGEQILKEKQQSNPLLLDNQELELISLGIKDLGNDGSSSSLSWGNDCSNNGEFQIVSDELKRMDSVLMGLEPIPITYEQLEYQDWMRHFPTFCVIGTTLGIKMAKKFIPQIQLSHFEEILASHPRNTDIRRTISHQEKTKNYVENGDELTDSLVECICKKVNDKLFKSKIPRRIEKKKSTSLKCNPVDFTNLTGIDVDEYLKVSPIPSTSQHENESTEFVIGPGTEVSSKWIKRRDNDLSEEFTSLPFFSEDYLGNEPANTNNKITFTGSLSHKSPSRNNKGMFRKGILKNPLVLPPIKGVQCRSASATPRRPTVTFSAISFHQNNSKVKPRVETAQHFSVFNNDHHASFRRLPLSNSRKEA